MRPYFARTVPYYLVTVVQPYSENVAPSSFTYYIAQVSEQNKDKITFFLLNCRR